MNKEINNENDNLLLYIQQFLFIYNNFLKSTDNNTKLLISWLMNCWQQYKTTDKLTDELLTTIQNYW